MNRPARLWPFVLAGAIYGTAISWVLGVSRKHASPPAPDWATEASAIRRRLNELIAEGRTPAAIVMGPETYERQRAASGGRWDLRGNADLFSVPVEFDGAVESWTVRLRR